MLTSRTSEENALFVGDDHLQDLLLLMRQRQLLLNVDGRGAEQVAFAA